MAYFPEKVNIIPATPASDVNMFNGNYNFGGGTAVPSYSSTRFKYLGNVLTSILVDNGSGSAAGSFNINANLYFDGTSTFRSRANETCATLVINGQTTAAGTVMTLFADSSVASASGSAVTTVAKFSVNSLGSVTLGDASTNTTLVHQMHGSMNTLGTVIPSFSSTDFRYIGAKTNSILFKGGAVASAGNLNAYANMYFDGTSGKYARANETCVNLTIAGQTTATGAVYTLAADPSVSHAADIAATVVNIHTIDSNGAHAIGNASTNSAQVQQIYGSVNLKGAVVPSFSSTRYRYVGNKLTSTLYDDGSGSAAGTIYTFANLYYDGTNFRRSRASETCAQILVNGATAATSVVFTVAADSSVAGSADSTVSPATILSATSQGTFAFGPSSSNDAIVHTMYGSYNLGGTAIPSFSSADYRYIGTKMDSLLTYKTTSAAGNIFLYANTYFDGTTNKRTRANETCVRNQLIGTTAATSNVYVVDADPSVSHAADSTASYVNVHAITAQGKHTIGVSTQPTDFLHQFYNGIGVDITSSGTKAAFFRNQTTATTASVILGNAQVGNASIRWIDFAYNGSSSASPGTVEGYIGTDGAGNVGIVDISDARRKTNLRPLKNAVDELKKVPIYIFDRIDNGNKDLVGFIAQDVEKIDPRLVTELDDVKRVSRDALVHYMHAAILELTDRLEKLESKKKTKKDEE